MVNTYCRCGTGATAPNADSVVSPRNRTMLLEGLDKIGLTQALESMIAAFQVADRRRRPSIYPT